MHKYRVMWNTPDDALKSINSLTRTNYMLLRFSKLQQDLSGRRQVPNEISNQETCDVMALQNSGNAARVDATAHAISEANRADLIGLGREFAANAQDLKDRDACKRVLAQLKACWGTALESERATQRPDPATIVFYGGLPRESFRNSAARPTHGFEETVRDQDRTSWFESGVQRAPRENRRLEGSAVSDGDRPGNSPELPVKRRYGAVFRERRIAGDTPGERRNSGQTTVDNRSPVNTGASDQGLEQRPRSVLRMPQPEFFPQSSVSHHVSQGAGDDEFATGPSTYSQCWSPELHTGSMSSAAKKQHTERPTFGRRHPPALGWSSGAQPLYPATGNCQLRQGGTLGSRLVRPHRAGGLGDVHLRPPVLPQPTRYEPPPREGPVTTHHFKGFPSDGQPTMERQYPPLAERELSERVLTPATTRSQNN